MKDMRIDIYGPRMKILQQGDEFVLLLDELDESVSPAESKVVIITCPRGQLEEWTRAFAEVLGS